jgi:hypothetical protein
MVPIQKTYQDLHNQNQKYYCPVAEKGTSHLSIKTGLQQYIP